jgi:hypothetical protein
MVLTAIDEPGSGDDAESRGLTYDAIEMDHDAAKAFDPGKVSVQIEPSIFYQKKGRPTGGTRKHLRAPQFCRRG